MSKLHACCLCVAEAFLPQWWLCVEWWCLISRTASPQKPGQTSNIMEQSRRSPRTFSVLFPFQWKDILVALWSSRLFLFILLVHTGTVIAVTELSTLIDKCTQLAGWMLSISGPVQIVGIIVGFFSMIQLVLFSWTLCLCHMCHGPGSFQHNLELQCLVLARRWRWHEWCTMTLSVSDCVP